TRDPHGDLVGSVADREALFVAGIDPVSGRLAADRAGHPAEDAPVALAVEFESDRLRDGRSPRGEAPRPTPGSPASLVVTRPDAPEVLGIRTQQAQLRQAVARPARVGGPRDELGKAHRKGPLHVGAIGELEMVVGDGVAIRIARGPPAEGDPGPLGLT